MMLRRSIHEVDPRAGQQNSHRALAPVHGDELDSRAGAAKNLRRHAEVYAPSVHTGNWISFIFPCAADVDELDPRAGAAELSLMMLRRSIMMSIRGQDSITRKVHSLERMMMSSTRGQVQLSFH